MSGAPVKRRSRNESEKKRRDAFNRLIEQLASELNEDGKKVDKSCVIELAIDFLKHRNDTVQCSSSETLPTPFASLPFQATATQLVSLYMESLSAGTVILDSAGLILRVSSTFALFFKSKASGLVGSSLCARLDPSSSSTLTAFLSDQLLRAAAPGATHPLQTGEVLLRTKTGEDFRLIGRMKRESESLVFVGVFIPTVRVPLEFPTSNLPRLTAPFKIVYNGEFNILSIDAGVTSQLGYTNWEVWGKNGYELVHNEDLPQLALWHKQVAESGGWVGGHRLLTKAGDWLWVECRLGMERHGETRRITCEYTHSHRAHFAAPLNVVRRSSDSVVRMKSTPPPTGAIPLVSPLSSPSPSISAFSPASSSVLSPRPQSTTMMNSPRSHPKRRSQQLVYVEHFPLEPKMKSPASGSFPLVSPTPTPISPAPPTSIPSDPLSPYQRTWEHLQHSFQSLQQQVRQKELELNQLLLAASGTQNGQTSV